MNRSRVGYIPTPRLKNRCRCDECLESEFIREQAKIRSITHLRTNDEHCYDTNNEEKKYFLEHLNEQNGSGDAYDTKKIPMRDRATTHRRNVTFNYPHGESTRRSRTCTGIKTGDTRNYEDIHSGDHDERESENHLLNRRVENDRKAWKPKVFLELKECRSDPVLPPPMSQESMNYLNMVKLVHKMKPLWDEIVAENETDARLHRYSPGTHRRVQRSDKCEYYCAESPIRPHRDMRHDPDRYMTYRNRCQFQQHGHTENEGDSRGYHAHRPHEPVASRHHRQQFKRSDSESRTYHKDVAKLHKSRKSKSDIRVQGHRKPEAHRGTKTKVGDINIYPTVVKRNYSAERNRKEIELGVGSSNEWYDSDTDEDKIRRTTEVQSGKSEQYEERELSPSRYTYAEKRSLFSPKQSLIDATKGLKQSEGMNKQKLRTHERVMTEENANSAETTHIQNLSERNELNSLHRYEQINEARHIEHQEKATRKFISRSEGGGRNIIKLERKSGGSVHRSNSGPMHSKYSQTQAELELDYKLLQKYLDQPKETKASQTEVILNQGQKVKEDDSWDEWISEGSKRKPKKKHRESTKTEIRKYSEQNDEILQKTWTDRTSKSIPIYSNPNVNLTPRRSHSDSANPDTQQKHYRTSLHTEIHPHNQDNHLKSPDEKLAHDKNRTSIPRPHEDGFKVLRHSKSLSWTLLAHKEKPTNEASAQNRGRKGHGSYLTPSQSRTNESLNFVTETASTSYAMEHAGIGPTNETLQLLSEEFDSLIVSEPTIQNLDVQDSKLLLNNSVGKMRQASNTNICEGRNSLSPEPGEKFIWRSHSFLPGQTHQSRYTRQSKLCQKCKEAFLEGEDFLESRSHNLRWHVQCFHCEICEVILDQTNHYISEDRLFCVEHYARKVNVPKCTACQEFIFEDRYTLAHGVPWHTNHFKCSHCEKTIIQTKYVTTHGEDFCLECHRNLMARKCSTCGITIAVTQPFVQTGDKVWHAREQCLHCFTCHKSLVNRNRMFEKNGVTFCNRYCAIRNAPPV